MLTPVNHYQQLYVDYMTPSSIVVKELDNKNIHCFYEIRGERTDIAKLEIEVKNVSSV